MPVIACRQRARFEAVGSPHWTMGGGGIVVDMVLDISDGKEVRVAVSQL